MKNKKILKIGAVLVLTISAFFVWQKVKSRSTQEQFKRVTVEKGSLRITAQATGTTLPQNRLELKPPVSGRIETMQVEEGQTVRKGGILAWMSSTERAALLDAARAKGEKEVAYWEEIYKPTPLISPMDGVIIARNMEPGQTVTTQDVPLVMSDRLIVKAQVDETDIGQLRLGQKAEITLDAYPQIRIPGKVSHIAYESKTVNNVTMYGVDVLPEKVPALMRSGMTSNLTFIVREKENVLLLPQEAVRNMQDETRVFVPSAEEGKGRKRASKAIRTGLSDGKKIEVVEGLSEGDTVLVLEIRSGKLDLKQSGASNPFMPFGRSRTGGRGGGGR